MTTTVKAARSLPQSLARSLAILLTLFGLAFLGLSQAAQPAAVPSPSAIVVDHVYTAFLGEWVGQLEYRDFRSNARVVLPAWLHVTRTADGRTLQFAYVYDDGPSKTVKELVAVSLDAATATIRFSSDRERDHDSYTVQGLAEFAAKNEGTLTLTGGGTENGKKVDVRITIGLRRNLYTYTKETRLPGEEFQFRDGYTFTRKEAPV